MLELALQSFDRARRVARIRPRRLERDEIWLVPVPIGFQVTRKKNAASTAIREKLRQHEAIAQHATRSDWHALRARRDRHFIVKWHVGRLRWGLSRGLSGGLSPQGTVPT